MTDEHASSIALGDPSTGPLEDVSGPLLENTGNNLSPVTLNLLKKTHDRRSERWAKRAFLWDQSRLQSVKQCGRTPRSLPGGVQARLYEGRAGFAGLQRCGSVWACPVDAAKIRYRRAWEIGSVTDRALADGWRLVFFTLTVPHCIEQTLREVWAAVGKAWQATISGKQWQQAAKDAGLLGWLRVQEVGHGVNGWHPHIHGIMVVPGGTDDEVVEALFSGMFERWQRAAVRGGMAEPQRWSQDWKGVEGPNAAEDLGKYLAKIAEVEGVGFAMGLELTHSLPGRAKKVARTVSVWQLLDEARVNGDADAMDAWWEYEATSKGKRMIGYSRSLREAFPLEEKSDEEIADEEWGSADHDVLDWRSEDWAAVVRVPGLAPRVLNTLEAGGVEAASRLLLEYGIDHRVLS